MPGLDEFEVSVYASKTQAGSVTAQQVISHLRRSRISGTEACDAEDSGFGILLADRLDDDVFERVRLLSRGGQNRLLVLLQQRLTDHHEAVWQALGAGASDVLVWEQLPDPGAAIGERLHRWLEIDTLISQPLVTNHLVGESEAWRMALRRLVEAARFSSWPVLLTGETGTGKELAARLIHTLDSVRHRAELIILDCTTIVPELSGSELFGHERGAFTGAVAARDGAFAMADGGTLFLDEVGELHLHLQVQLLRALQEHSYKRVGSNTWRQTDFRLISATNRDLQSEASEGRFRTDLYHRVATICVALPPLRDRPQDVLPLARHFVRTASESADAVPELDEAVELYLLTRDYPGNVRDLSNLMHRIMARHVGHGPITAGDIPPEERPESGVPLQGWCDGRLEALVRQAFASGVGLREIRRMVEDTAIRIALEEENGSVRRAAQRLALTGRALQKRRAEQRKTQLAS
jgi:transcriptional regulator with GAF, ATPase, and Fis domain